MRSELSRRASDRRALVVLDVTVFPDDLDQFQAEGQHSAQRAEQPGLVEISAKCRVRSRPRNMFWTMSRLSANARS